MYGKDKTEGGMNEHISRTISLSVDDEEEWECQENNIEDLEFHPPSTTTMAVEA